MHRIFKKHYNLIIKNFIAMCLRREQHYPSHIAMPYRVRVIRVKLKRNNSAQNLAVPKRLRVKDTEESRKRR